MTEHHTGSFSGRHHTGSLENKPGSKGRHGSRFLIDRSPLFVAPEGRGGHREACVFNRTPVWCPKRLSGRVARDKELTVSGRLSECLYWDRQQAHRVC